MKNLRKKRLFGFGAESGGILDEGGGGGVRGTFAAGIVVEVGVTGVTELGVTTAPGGSGSEVAALADPGSTGGLESAILGLSE